jgi:hypothetical protein
MLIVPDARFAFDGTGYLTTALRLEAVLTFGGQQP